MITEEILNEIIPPANYSSRNGFNNEPIIDKLSIEQKKYLEKALIKRLEIELTLEYPDTLIVETLSYLKSQESLPYLNKLLDICKDPIRKLRIITSIYEIKPDNDLIDPAINFAKQLDNKKSGYYIYELSNAFVYLSKMNNEKVRNFINGYTLHPEFLLSSNANQILLEMKKKN